MIHNDHPGDSRWNLPICLGMKRFKTLKWLQKIEEGTEKHKKSSRCSFSRSDLSMQAKKGTNSGMTVTCNVNLIFIIIFKIES